MTVLLSVDELAERQRLIAKSPELAAIAAHLRSDVGRVLDHPLYVPEQKALLSRWGASCRDDEAPLAFDPFSPDEQRCTKCGRIWQTEQSRRWWVYWYQLWLAERVLMMALQPDDGAAHQRALETLALIVERYQHYPNADNVLGPSRPFFSTYLESIWVLHLASATGLLRLAGRVPKELDDDLSRHLFGPSAAIIADFPEGRSNRQVWNAAALYALGRVLDDEALARDAAHGEGGIIASLRSGLLADGLWYEGENYHWFALRGLAWGAQLLGASGEADLFNDEGAVPSLFRSAFRAPVLTALPDFTFPARRDSKFGVSLRQRRMAELWEMAAQTRDPVAAEQYASLLRHVYDPSVPLSDSAWQEITDVERPNETHAGVRRDRLGWKALLFAAPDLPDAPPDAWRPHSAHLEASGLAIFRRDEGGTYLSLDYGESGGGHGHPDRLNLTLVVKDTPWLLDFGTGSYVAPSLSWYRSTLAHNAPLVDGQSQAAANGSCVAHDDQGGYGWICAVLPDGGAYDGATIQRTIVLTPGYILDVVQMGAAAGERQLAVPWHGLGEPTVDELGITFVRQSGVGGGQSDQLRILLGARQRFQVLLQKAPGPPGQAGAEDMQFAIAFGSGEAVTLAACIDLGAGVEEVECVDDDFIVRLPGDRVHAHRATDEGWEIELDHGDPVELGGLRDEQAGDQGPEGMAVPGDRFAIGGAQAPGPRPPALSLAGSVQRVRQPPVLDGTLDGFPGVPSLVLDRPEHFRRAEEQWKGAADFSARAFLCHDGEALYAAVEVTGRPAFRPPESVDPEWENENPDIHGAGLQLYVESTGFFGWLVVPDARDESKLRVSGVRGTDGEREMITGGAWSLTDTGYRVTLAIQVPDELAGDVGFDLLVNQGEEGRERRTGQLVWSGAHGARLYLAGDRAPNVPLPRLALE